MPTIQIAKLTDESSNLDIAHVNPLTPLLLLACLTLMACSRSTRLSVINKSSSELSHVVASGAGFSQRIGSFAPGAEVRVTIEPSGESALRLAFDADGKHFATPALGYFEIGYNVSATVDPDFNVIVDAVHRY